MKLAEKIDRTTWIRCGLRMGQGWVKIYENGLGLSKGAQALTFRKKYVKTFEKNQGEWTLSDKTNFKLLLYVREKISVLSWLFSYVKRYPDRDGAGMCV